jgi:hypothetical protein
MTASRAPGAPPPDQMANMQVRQLMHQEKIASRCITNIKLEGAGAISRCNREAFRKHKKIGIKSAGESGY